MGFDTIEIYLVWVLKLLPVGQLLGIILDKTLFFGLQGIRNIKLGKFQLCQNPFDLWLIYFVVENEVQNFLSKLFVKNNELFFKLGSK